MIRPGDKASVRLLKDLDLKTRYALVTVLSIDGDSARIQFSDGWLRSFPVDSLLPPF